MQTAILKQEELATKAVLFVEENVIEKIAAGGTYFAKEILKELEKFCTLKKENQETDLKNREIETIKLMEKEISNKLIVEKVFTSERTV